MLIQPRGFKRISTSATLLLSIRREVEKLAARFNCSKSFVVATILAEQLGIKEQVKFYEVKQRDKKGTTSVRSNSKVVRIKPRERRSA